MNILSNANYPAKSLSNFTHHPFIIDSVSVNSMEGFLQSLKFKDIEKQKYICTLIGYNAKLAGKLEKWYNTQKLYWLGVEYYRDSDEYQKLLDKAYLALSKNNEFIQALLATGHEILTHSIGKRRTSNTVLTEREFCSRLMKIRAHFQAKVLNE